MKFVTLGMMLSFFVFRYYFTFVKGKRSREKVTSGIFVGRKLIEICICFLIPALLLLEVIKTNISPALYYVGILFSFFGLFLMAWTRFNRSTDWGFMGDTSGEQLLTSGPYQLTRHPYYLGAIFYGVGLYLQLHYFFVLLMLLVIAFISHVIRKEEDFLEKKFGSQYLDYKKRVGIFPWFYPIK